MNPVNVSLLFFSSSRAHSAMLFWACLLSALCLNTTSVPGGLRASFLVLFHFGAELQQEGNVFRELQFERVIVFELRPVDGRRCRWRRLL